MKTIIVHYKVKSKTGVEDFNEILNSQYPMNVDQLAPLMKKIANKHSTTEGYVVLCNVFPLESWKY